MNAIERDQSLRVRVAAEELRMVHALAESEGITASDWVRMAIRRAYAEKFPEKPPKRAK